MSIHRNSPKVVVAKEADLGAPRSADGIDAKFVWARDALKATQFSTDAKGNGFDDPDGWRWRVLADLEELHGVIVRDYTKARDKQKSQAWETRWGPIFTGAGAALGAAFAAVGASFGSGRWGWAFSIPGVVIAIVGSVVGANSYVRSRNQKLRYLHLMHALADYAYLVLPVAEPAEAFQQLDSFRQMWESAGT
ncbi:MAG TPA: hypothetical protein VFN61_06810 [Acidimicrobiales bacterium]|nr:hypothetical protein [Acidimicrobiales bacterium]